MMKYKNKERTQGKSGPRNMEKQTKWINTFQTIRAWIG